MVEGTRRQIKTPRIRQRAFLAAIAECGNIKHAAALAGINRCMHYRWLDNDPDYLERFREAEETAVESMEMEARRRAVEGSERPVFYRGVQCGVIREYSDRLLIFLLKAARPEKYRDRVPEAGGMNSGPLRIVIDGDLDTDIYGNGS